MSGPVVGHDGDEAMNAYIGLRDALDRIWDQADKYTDPKTNQVQLPKGHLELRADADTEYRVIQEIQQIASDSNDPNNKMKPKTGTSVPSFTFPFHHPQAGRIRRTSMAFNKVRMMMMMKSKAI